MRECIYLLSIRAFDLLKFDKWANAVMLNEGGHFAALEQTKLLMEDMEEFVEQVWKKYIKLLNNLLWDEHQLEIISTPRNNSAAFPLQTEIVAFMFSESTDLLWARYWTKAGVCYLQREWQDEAWPEVAFLRGWLIGTLSPVILAALAVIDMIQDPDDCDPQDHLVAALGIVVHSPHSSLGGKSLCTSPLQAKVSIDLLV